MRKSVRKFKSLEIAIKELAPVFQNRAQLLTGRGFENFDGGRPRELAGNWLLAVVLNHLAGKDDFTFTSDTDRDGIIFHAPSETALPTEHILVPPAAPGDGVSSEQWIADQVAKKQAKGTAYARGMMLVIWNMRGDNLAWHPNKAARQLPLNDFHKIWVVGLHAVRADCWTFSVALLGPATDRPGLTNVPTWIVDIDFEHAKWAIHQTQFAINATATFDIDPPCPPLVLEFLI